MALGANAISEVAISDAGDVLGSLAVTLGAVVVVGTGTVEVQGALAVTLGALTVVGTGTVVTTSGRPHGGMRMGAHPMNLGG